MSKGFFDYLYQDYTPFFWFCFVNLIDRFDLNTFFKIFTSIFQHNETIRVT